MIKNEEKIIERCIQNAVAICDAICVTDTGSTDSTCNKVIELFKTINIPGKLYNDTWQNFGHNRTNSFNNTVDFCKELGWDLSTTYGLLLDADMILKTVNFNKEIL
jgi:glycosyltransferase involved in cell wall biosynthesis